MKNNRKVRVSLFLRILFPLLLSLILIQVITMQTVRPLIRSIEMKYGLGPGPGPGMPRPMEEHRRIEAALDENTPLDVIPTILGNNTFDIRFEGPTRSWSTKDDLPSWSSLQNSPELHVGMEAGTYFGRINGKSVWVSESPRGRAMIFSDGMGGPKGMPPLHSGFWILFGVQVTLILLLCYGILYWQLRGIKLLNAGVNAIAQGNLKHQVPVNDSSELGVLSAAFNEMVEKLRLVIQAKEELILGVSHELRSPLASMEVAIEMIDDEKRKNQLRVYTRQMKLLIEELLDSHRISSDHRKLNTIAMDVVPFIKNIIHLIEVPDREIHFTHPEDEPVAEFDGVRMEKVIRNLLENALKFSDYKSSVAIELIDEKNELKIVVTDNGPGIPSDELKNIFEPFYRVEKSRSKDTGGYGLGLFLCKKIVEAHRGRIWAENRREGGAVFTLVIPKNTPVAEAA